MTVEGKLNKNRGQRISGRQIHGLENTGTEVGTPSSVVKISSVKLEEGSLEVTELRWEGLITYRWHWFLDERGKR
jgi:hypothetical protein